MTGNSSIIPGPGESSLPEHLADVSTKYQDGHESPQGSVPIIAPGLRISPGGEEALPNDSKDVTLPNFIGRYRVEQILGKGGFGLVYLAHDDNLDRFVAIKVPKEKLLDQAQVYLNEAQIVARLDHPNIVTVYDVGSTPEFPCFIVSKYVKGWNLSQRLAGWRFTEVQSAELVATLADALHHAHCRGLVHRDIKPSNILLDDKGTPYISDFGLALTESEFGKGSRYLGSPGYMSPEQARGEGHRVDGRSDIFSLGVVFYELLVGRRPFQADRIEVLSQIQTAEPPAPRQVNPRVPRELERICLKALSKRASDRYATALELSNDLHCFLKMQPRSETELAETFALDSVPVDTSAPVTPNSNTGTLAASVVPKGLRSFDERDADFFLQLLPGPRDRLGLPESIRFWKARIEETDPDRLLTVGLIYGPSGCGKSSLIKAGVFPHLEPWIVPIFVEATEFNLEQNLLMRLRHRFPRIEEVGLPETLANIRRGAGLAHGHRLLIVIDQFEQWLHGVDRDRSVLINALRQCEGIRLQCIMLIRDDFWMSATRLFREIEVRLVGGQNCSAVDLFDLPHAERVLTSFGRAFGALPEGALSSQDRNFLKHAVALLAQQGHVIPLYLALFAEMLKGRPWKTETLQLLGGASGLGAAYLEDSFTGSSAPPLNRLHVTAARAVLERLLPEPGVGIKGNMRSERELAECTEYLRPHGGQDRKAFEELKEILVNDMRLLTPVDPHLIETPNGIGSQTYYQLTHDYLVPSLREWLTRQQRQTFRGRAQLRLQDLEATWSVRPDTRQLPGLADWFRISALTDNRNWTLGQRRMMTAASRYHGLRCGIACLFLALASWFAYDTRQTFRASALVQTLESAEITQVPELLLKLQPFHDRAQPLLKELADKLPEGSPGRLNIGLALVREHLGEMQKLIPYMDSADPKTLNIICDRVSNHRDELVPRFWQLLESPDTDPILRLRAGQVIAEFDPPAASGPSARWEACATALTNNLVSQTLDNPRDYAGLVAAFMPIRQILMPPLRVVFREKDERRRYMGTNLYIEFANGDADVLAAILPEADPTQFARIYPVLEAQPAASIKHLEKLLAQPAPSSVQDTEFVDWAKQHAIAAVALLKLGSQNVVWPFFRHSPDPTVRSLLIHDLVPYNAPAESLVARLRDEKDVSAVRGLLLGLGEFKDSRCTREVLRSADEIGACKLKDADPGVRAAAAWMIRNLGLNRPDLTAEDGQTVKEALQGKGSFVDSAGNRMILFDGRNVSGVGCLFAMADREVTTSQFKRFDSSYEPHRESSPTDDCPANIVSWYRALAYCNWLTLQEGMGQEAQCYYPGSNGILTLHDDCSSRKGYRLPSREEWMLACAAGATTNHSFGRSTLPGDAFAWNLHNSQWRLWPCGLLKPNDAGMYDMHGNVLEWCNSPASMELKELKGGSSKGSLGNMVIWHSEGYLPETAFYSVGFRVVRTIPDSE